MNFTELNMETWERGTIFQHFINNLRCVMNMTVEIDVTDFLRAIDKKGYKFYPAMMWASALQSIPGKSSGWDMMKTAKQGYGTMFHPTMLIFIKKKNAL